MFDLFSLLILSTHIARVNFFLTFGNRKYFYFLTLLSHQLNHPQLVSRHYSSQLWLWNAREQFHSWFFPYFDLLPCYCFKRSKSLKALTWIAVQNSGTQCSLYENNRMPCHLGRHSYILLDFNQYQILLIL